MTHNTRLLQRVAEQHFTGGTREYLLEPAKKRIRELKSVDKSDGKIEKNPKFSDLRVRLVAEAGTPLVEPHPKHPPPKATEEMPPSEAYGGIHAKTLRLTDYAREALSALGDPIGLGDAN
jgi:hypothetical protein